MKNKIENLRTGYTTGTCATAATAAALQLLLNNVECHKVRVELPAGEIADIEIIESQINADTVTASVKKDAGDDPDITHGAIIQSTVNTNNSGNINFFAGTGVGTVTKAGLQIPIGEAAINPIPRKMMQKAIRNITNKGVDITISVVNGEQLAEKTFNPRLGIVGGISIIGTSGIVRPFSHKAIADTVRVNIDVALANGAKELIFVAGHYGMKAVEKLFKVKTEEIIEVSNSWDAALRHARENNIDKILILSHPGKLAKFIDRHFNTHSSFSPSALPIVKRIADKLKISYSEASVTVEGIFRELSQNEKKRLADNLAHQIREATELKSGINAITITLIDMQQNELGTSSSDIAYSGEQDTWQRK